eukprot:428628_1
MGICGAAQVCRGDSDDSSIIRQLELNGTDIEQIHEPMEFILNFSDNIINGMIPIEIENITEICDFLIEHPDFAPLCRYKFTFTTNQHGYENNKWYTGRGMLLSAYTHNKVTFKVPLILSQYLLEFCLMIVPTTKNSTRAHQLLSQRHSVIIPSVLLEPTFDINDYVGYQKPNSFYTNECRIIEFLPNNMVKIKNRNQEIITINKSKLHTPTVYSILTIDMTEKRQLFSDLILKTENKKQIDIFSQLHSCVQDTYFPMYNAEIIDDEYWQIPFLCQSMAFNIYELLYLPEFNYHVKCPFDGNELFCRQQWSFYLNANINAIQKGLEIAYNDIQDSWQSGSGYSCDICRLEMSYYEFMYHSDTGNGQCTDVQHDYCLSCVHSIIKQYCQLKPFLLELLRNELDDVCCVDEIVSYCIGKVIRFDAKQSKMETL